MNWRQQGAISKRAKMLAISMMAASFVILWFFSSAPLFIRIGTAIVLAGSASYVLTRPQPKLPPDINNIESTSQ